MDMNTSIIGLSNALVGLIVLVASVVNRRKLRGGFWKNAKWLFALGGMFLLVGGLSYVLEGGVNVYLGVFFDAFIIAGYALLLGSVLFGTTFILQLQGLTEKGTALVPRTFALDLRKKIEDLYGRRNISTTMYSLGKAVGKSYGSSMVKSYKSDPRALIRAIPQTAILANWAEKAKIVEDVEKEILVLRVHNDLETLDKHSAAVPSCDFVRGAFAGMAESFSTGMCVDAVETSCQTRGDDYCEFVANISPFVGPVRP